MNRSAMWLMLLPVVGLGCGGGSGELSGKVTYQGKAVVVGSVMAVGGDGLPRYGDIAKDGTYRVAGVPAGDAVLTVTSPKPGEARTDRAAAEGGRGREGRAPPPEARTPVDPDVVKKWFPIPDHFADPTRSGLKTTVRSGSTAHDIELK